MVSPTLEGQCGRWQVRLALLLALPVLLTGMYCTNYVFLAAYTPYRCRVSECETWDNSSSTTLWTQPALDPLEEDPQEAEWAPLWAPWALPAGDRCRRWAPVDGLCEKDSFDNTTAHQCEHFLYQSGSSIFSEFNLACQEWKRNLVGTVHNVGMLISLPIIGYVSDRWGRRSALVVSGVGAGLLGLVKSFAPTYGAYLVLELLETILGASVYPAAFVLMIEWLGLHQRILASLILGIPLAAGSATLALLDYLAADWRLWARVAYPPSFLLLLYPWLLPESVRWLTAQGRLEEALRTVKRAARYNGSPVPDEALQKMLMSEAEQLARQAAAGAEDDNLLKAFFRCAPLRRRLLVCGAWWVSAVFVFYGLAARAHALAGSAHVNYALLAAAELPALLLNTLLLDRVGRRALLTASFLLTAATLIAIPCLPDSDAWPGTALYLLGKVGATMTLNALYVYTAELFPTRARHRLLATCSTLGRLGSILAPLTPLLAAYRPWLPTALLGALPLASAALTRLLPDTLRARLPDTLADLRRAGPLQDTP